MSKSLEEFIEQELSYANENDLARNVINEAIRVCEEWVRIDQSYSAEQLLIYLKSWAGVK